MPKTEKMRPLEPRLQDILSPDFTGVTEIAESDIANFCNGCDTLGEDGVCGLRKGYRDQARYVNRKWCGWAEVSGIRGVMTKDGFSS